MLPGGGFIGLVSEEPIAFACTLTKKNKLKDKLKDDVAAIVGGETPVKDVHCFCSADLAVGERHVLQQWAGVEHGVHLEIYDGQAIAELLVNPDVFWIAIRYLSIPAEIYPSAPVGEENAWYVRSRGRWMDPELAPQNLADFVELKAAIRYATKTEDSRSDLPFWLEKLSALKSATERIPPLQRRVTYEITVASLKGLRTLEGHETELRAYFAGVPELVDSADIEDAAVLWTHCDGARRYHMVGLTQEELASWRDKIVAKVESELAAAELPGRRCALLDIRAFLHLVMFADTPGGKPNIKDAIRTWEALADLVDEAPLFPLERLADRLTTFIVKWSEPELDKLTSRVDELLVKRKGQAVAAKKCLARAAALGRNGEIIRAIKQIHQAKAKWFAQETLHASVIAMLELSRCYLNLGLAFAGKYYGSWQLRHRQETTFTPYGVE